jgi:anti-sigma regulatory factor (Ser/Thr protein kinase)
MLATTWWPFRSRLELGALPSAVPSARLHARLVVGEWGLESIANTVELVVSELVTNGVKAAQGLDYGSAVRLELSGDEHQVLVAVWDGNPEPIQTSVPGDDELPDLEAEGGRGLFLVDSLSTDWDVCWPDDAPGKVVWCLVAVSEADDVGAVTRRRGPYWPLPKRVPSGYPIRRPAHALDDVGVLERVRESLKKLA